MVLTLQILNLIKNNWKYAAVILLATTCYIYGYNQANLKAAAKHAEELAAQIELRKEAEENAARLRTDIETKKQEFENEIKNNKVYSDCVVPNAAKLHINSIK